MESLAQLVSDSMVRNGFDTAPDHRRLRWSPWFPCQESLNALFVPSKPGLLALGEEIIAPRETGKRMLALFYVAETTDLGLALARLLITEQRERLASAICFARFSVIEDAAQRRAALQAFQQWMANSAETASGIAMQELGIV